MNKTTPTGRLPSCDIPIFCELPIRRTPVEVDGSTRLWSFLTSGRISQEAARQHMPTPGTERKMFARERQVFVEADYAAIEMRHFISQHKDTFRDASAATPRKCVFTAR